MGTDEHCTHVLASNLGMVLVEGEVHEEAQVLLFAAPPVFLMSHPF